MANNRILSDWTHDEDFHNVYRLFPDVGPDSYGSEQYVPIDISSVSPTYGDVFAATPSVPDFDAAEVLNFETMVLYLTCSDPNFNNSNGPCLPCPSSPNPVEEEHAKRMRQDVVEPFLPCNSVSSVDKMHDKSMLQDGAEQVSVDIDSQAGSSSNHSPARSVAKQEPLQCPRCNSRNTKFSYYNNNNRNQPRHLCRGCQTQWTVGGSLRPRNQNSSTVKSVGRKRGRGHTAQIAVDGREFAVKGSEDHTGNGLERPFKSRRRNKEPVSTNGETVPRIRRGGRKRKTDPIPRWEFSNSFLKYSAAPGDNSHAGAYIPCFDFSQLPAIPVPDLRNYQGAFLHSPTAHVLPAASVNHATLGLQFAQNPRMSSEDEHEREFQGFTAPTAPCSLSELRKRYAPIKADLLHRLKGAILTSPPNSIHLKIPQDHRFQTVEDWNPSARLDPGQQEGVEMAAAMAINGNEGHGVAGLAVAQDLNPKAPAVDSRRRDWIMHPTQRVTLSQELVENCELNIDFLMSRTLLQCTCVAPSSSNGEGKGKAKVPESVKVCEFGRNSMTSVSEVICTCVAPASTSNNPKKTRRFPSRFGIYQEDGVDGSTS